MVRLRTPKLVLPNLGDREVLGKQLTYLIPHPHLRPVIFLWALTSILIGFAVGVGHMLPASPELLYTADSFRSDANIVLLDIDRNLRDRMTNRNRRNAHPSWSPDGKFIVYNGTSNTDSFRLVIMDANGHNKIPQAIAGRTIQSGVYWSPDGRRILFSVLGPDASAHYGILDLVTGKTTIASGRLRTPIWLPDSQNILDFFSGDLHGVNVHCTSETEDCEFKKIDFLRNQTFYSMPLWSRDGRTIVFSQRNEQGSKIIIARLRCADLIETCVEGYETLVNTPEATMAPFWSPDDQQIAFVSPQTKLTVINLKTRQSNSFNTPGIAPFRQTWSPDGRFIAYLGKHEEIYNFYVLNLETGESRIVMPHWYNDDLPQWRPPSP